MPKGLRGRNSQNTGRNVGDQHQQHRKARGEFDKERQENYRKELDNLEAALNRMPDEMRFAYFTMTFNELLETFLKRPKKPELNLPPVELSKEQRQAMVLMLAMQASAGMANYMTKYGQQWIDSSVSSDRSVAATSVGAPSTTVSTTNSLTQASLNSLLTPAARKAALAPEAAKDQAEKQRQERQLYFFWKDVISSEALATHIQEYRSSHPGELVSLDALKSRFQTLEGKLVLPEELKNLDLSNVDFRETVFNTNTIGSEYLDLTNCNLSNSLLPHHSCNIIHIKNCILDGGDWSNTVADIFDIDLYPEARTSQIHSSCKNVNFSNSNLNWFRIGSPADFAGSKFENVTLGNDMFYDYRLAKNLDLNGVRIASSGKVISGWPEYNNPRVRVSDDADPNGNLQIETGVIGAIGAVAAAGIAALGVAHCRRNRNELAANNAATNPNLEMPTIPEGQVPPPNQDHPPEDAASISSAGLHDVVIDAVPEAENFSESEADESSVGEASDGDQDQHPPTPTLAGAEAEGIVDREEEDNKSVSSGGSR